MINASFGLRLGGDLYFGWEEISIRRDLTCMSGEFNVSLMRQMSDGTIPQIQPGRSVHVEIDNAPVLIGWIDSKNVSYSADTVTLSISGRDKVGDLIDCAATVKGPFEYNNMPLDAVIRKIVEPFKITVKSELNPAPTIKRLAIQPGETAFDFIDRACRAHGVLPVSDGIGGLVLTRPASERSAGALIFGQNILTGEMTVDATQRHSLYVVKGQAESLDGTTEAKQMAGGEGRVEDGEVTRYRPKVLVGENQGYSGTLKERALWERKADRARGTKASYVVHGWYAADSVLWRPNTLVSVTDPIAGIASDMLIVAVEFSRGAQGTNTRLDLALPEAFDIDTKANSDSDDGSTNSNASGSGATTVWADDND